MTTSASQTKAAPRPGISLETWAVLLALAAALLVRFGIIKTVPW